MIRSLALASALTLGAAMPALAAEEAASSAASPDLATYTAHMAASANADQVRKLLNAQGYRNVSELNRDDTGRWTGTATKDGKAVGVSVKLPVKPAAPAAIN